MMAPWCPHGAIMCGFPRPLPLPHHHHTSGQSGVLPTSQVRSLTGVPKTCQCYSGARSWPKASSTPCPSPPSSVSHPALSDLLGCSSHLLGPERPLPSILQPSLLFSYIQFMSLISKHMFFMKAMNSVPGCAGLPLPSAVPTAGVQPRGDIEMGMKEVCMGGSRESGQWDEGCKESGDEVRQERSASDPGLAWMLGRVWS